ncbi:DEAD/DEAH box helicase, partial [Xenorhabdus bovienii]
EACSDFSKHMRNVNVVALYGGQRYDVQLRALRQGPQVVVGTPGRLLDHLKRGTLDLSNLKGLVLDEADEMLRMGFIEDVENI